jgi:hypothetical protein
MSTNVTGELVDQLIEHLTKEGGRLVISFDIGDSHPPLDPKTRAVVGYEFGKEEPDNPDNDMCGGAAYGMAPTVYEALVQVADQVGIS